MKSKGLTEIKPVQVADNTEDIDAMLDRQNKVEVENKAPEDKGFIEENRWLMQKEIEVCVRIDLTLLEVLREI